MEFVCFCLLLCFPYTFGAQKIDHGTYFETSAKELELNAQKTLLDKEEWKCARTDPCESTIKYGNENKIVFQKMKATSFSSCAEALDKNIMVEDHYKIRLRNHRIVSIKCKSINNKATAIFHHDREKESEVHGYEAPGSYRGAIRYTNDIEDIKVFVDSSSSCRQFTRFNCHGVVLFSGSTQYGFLIDRNNNPMKYFGGGPYDRSGCSCGITNTCAKSGTVCNCDDNISSWKHDEGYVTEKERLPLIEVRLGDNGNGGEMVIYKIGRLECTE